MVTMEQRDLTSLLARTLLGMPMNSLLFFAVLLLTLILSTEQTLYRVSSQEKMQTTREESTSSDSPVHSLVYVVLNQDRTTSTSALMRSSTMPARKLLHMKQWKE